MRPRNMHRLDALAESFHVAKTRDKATDDLRRAAEAAIDGRVATLMLKRTVIIAGRIDAVSGGHVRRHGNSGVDDVLE